MKNMTASEAKKAITDYLVDDYCLSDEEIKLFLESIRPSALDSVAFHYITPCALVDSMIAWGNRKVERCAMTTHGVICDPKANWIRGATKGR